jgi:hypothetical protein
MFKLGFISLFTMVVAFAAAAPGCGAADRLYDCNAICTKYKDCVDANYDVGACRDRCQDNAADSEAYEDQADECQACVDDRSCAGAVFGCSSECVGIVP